MISCLKEVFIKHYLGCLRAVGGVIFDLKSFSCSTSKFLLRVFFSRKPAIRGFTKKIRIPKNLKNKPKALGVVSLLSNAL
jgi:hypothetical protein